MRFAFRARFEASNRTAGNVTSEVVYITWWRQLTLPVQGRLSSALAAGKRLTRDIRGTTAARPPRKVSTLLEVGRDRPSKTASLAASAVTVAHRNGTPSLRGTQSQGLPTWRTPGYRIGPPEGFLSRPEPIRKEVCHVQEASARTQPAVTRA